MNMRRFETQNMDRLALEIKRMAEQLTEYAHEIEAHINQSARSNQGPRLTVVRAPIQHDDWAWAELAWIAQMSSEQRRAMMLAGRVDIDRLKAAIRELFKLIDETP